MNSTIKNTLKFFLFGGAGFLILLLTYRKTNKAFLEDCGLKGIPLEECSLLDKLWLDITSSDIGWLTIVISLFLISNVSRAIRWRMLIKPLGKETKLYNAFFTIMVGYFANLGLPRMGEIFRVTLFSKYEKLPVEQVMGTWAVDRIFDVLSMLMVIGIAFLLEFDIIWGYMNENASGTTMTWLIILAAIGFAGLVILWLIRGYIVKTVIFKKIERIVMGFIEGLKTVKSLEKPWLFAFHSIAIWVMYYLMNYLCFFAFAPTAHLGASAGLVVFVFGAIGIVFPSPGGMGTYHAMIMAGLSIYGISIDDGFSFANILFFSINLFCNIAFGIVALIALPILNRGTQEAG